MPLHVSSSLPSLSSLPARHEAPRESFPIGWIDEPAIDPRKLAKYDAAMLPATFAYEPSTKQASFKGASAEAAAHAREAALASKLFSCPDVSSATTRSDEFSRFQTDVSRSFALVKRRPITGQNASYIKALEYRDASDFGVSVVTPDGGQYSIGDARAAFSIQSTSKPIDLLLALKRLGIDGVNDLVEEMESPMPFNAPSTAGAVDPSRYKWLGRLSRQGEVDANVVAEHLQSLKTPGSTFELSRVLARMGDTRPANAMCNMGALATSAQIQSRVGVNRDAEGRQSSGDARTTADMGTIGQIYHSMDLVKQMGRPAYGEPLFDIDFNVYASEIMNADGNQTLARQNLLHDGEPVVPHRDGEPAALHRDGRRDLSLEAFEAVDIYTSNCALRTNIAGLTSVYSTIANDGRNPFTGDRVFSRDHAQEVWAQIAAGGLYEGSRTFYDETGLIAKSGVGGAIVAFDPESGLTIGTYSTPLNAEGNSERGIDFLKLVAGSPSFETLRKSMMASRDREEMAF